MQPLIYQIRLKKDRDENEFVFGIERERQIGEIKRLGLAIQTILSLAYLDFTAKPSNG
jgi:hypothetical protein